MCFDHVPVVWSLTVVVGVWFFFVCFCFPCAALVLPHADQVLKSSVQPYISSILEALMEPVSQGFSEVREVLFRELVEISMNTVNEGGREALGKVRGDTTWRNGYTILYFPLHHHAFQSVSIDSI